MTEYIIIGDTKRFEGCLVKICRGDRELAESVLKQMLTNPTDHDKMLMKGHTNLRIKAVKEEDQWWNDSFLMSD